MVSSHDDRDPALYGLPVARQGGDPRCAVRGQCMGGNLIVTERAYPATNRRRPACIHVSEPMARNEVDAPGDVTGRERVTDRLVRRSGQPMPGARALVQCRPDARLGPGQLTAKHLREQMVIAVPLTGVVQRHEEEVLALEEVDDICRVSGPGDCVAKGRAEPVQDGRPREELPDVTRQSAQHLLGEKVDDEPVLASELPDEGPWRGMTAQGQRREIQPGRPSFSALEKNG